MFQASQLIGITPRAVARKCGKEFGGGPGQDGGVPAFQQWFYSGAMLKKLQKKIPNLSNNDYEIFRELLS